MHTLPALTDAMEQIKNIRFDWVVEEAFAEVPGWHPAVDNSIPVALRRWRKKPFSAWKSGEWKAFKHRLKRVDYDSVIDAQGLIKSAFLTRYVHAPVHGLSKLSAREPFASRFYTHPHAVAWKQHAVERVRQLFALSLNYKVPGTPGRFSLSGDTVQKSMDDACPPKSEQPYLVFLHGTTWVDKHWPVAYWCKLIALAESEGLAVFLPWGNEQERARAEYIAQFSRLAAVLPRLDLGGMASILSGAVGVVAVDSGLGHLTAALEVPVVSLYGPTSPELVGTYGKNQWHLSVNNIRAESASDIADVEPAIFRSLAPSYVWSQLQTAISSCHDTV